MDVKRFLIRLANTRAHYRLKYFLRYINRDQEIIRATPDGFWDNLVLDIFTATALMVLMKYYDISNSRTAARAIGLHPRSEKALRMATDQTPGYSKRLRRRILKACGLNPNRA